MFFDIVETWFSRDRHARVQLELEIAILVAMVGVVVGLRLLPMPGGNRRGR